MNQSEMRECFKCYYEAITHETHCPKCRRPLYTAHNIRVRGGLMIGVGLFLVLFMGAIAIGVAVLLLGASKDPQSAAKLNKEALTLLAVYGVFGAVIAFGLHSMLSGAWQVIFGKRNRIFIWIMWTLLGLIFVAGGIFRFLQG